MPYKYRRDIVTSTSNSYLAPGANYSVTVLPPGAIVTSGSSSTTATVAPGHGFVDGQRLLVQSSNTFLSVNGAPTATTITLSSATTLVAGDVLINLGSDGGSTSPDWLGSPIRIWSDPGTTSINYATVTTNSSGEYSYYHLLSNAWEVVRSGSTVLDVVQGLDKDTRAINVRDYGAKGDGATDDVNAMTAAANVASSYTRVNGFDALEVVFPRGNYLYSDGLAFTQPVVVRGEPGAVLNYSGTGYALKMGPDGLTDVTYINHLTYTVENLTFTGGASFTHGIYWNDHITQPILRKCNFRNFGNMTGYQVFYQTDNWYIRVDECEMWSSTASNFLKVRGYDTLGANDGGNSRLIMTNCQVWGGDGTNVGVWVNGSSSVISKCTFAGPTPAIRIGSWAYHTEVNDCYFETVSPTVGCKVIEFGDPDNSDGRASTVIDGIRLRDNYCNIKLGASPVGASTKYFFGPAQASGGIKNCSVYQNYIAVGSDTVEVVNLNNVAGQTGNWAERNIYGTTQGIAYTAKWRTEGASISSWRGDAGLIYAKNREDAATYHRISGGQTASQNVGIDIVDYDDSTVRGRIYIQGASPRQLVAEVPSGTALLTAGATAAGEVNVRRLTGKLGTVHVDGDYVISAGWGATASRAVASNSYDLRFAVTVTAAGGSYGASPTIELTFKNGAYATAPFASVFWNQATAPAVLSWTTTTTKLTITYNGTPGAGTYVISGMVIG